MKKKRNEAYKLVVVIGFLMMVMLPGALWFLVGPMIGDSNTENRTLAEMPVFDLRNIDEFPRSFDAYYNDHAPFRKYIGRAWANINYRVFRDSTSPSVLIGKTDGGPRDAWLFYDNDEDVKAIAEVQGFLKFDDEDKSIIKQAISHNLATAKKNDIDYYMIVAPNKENIYREYLPSGIDKFAEKTRTDELMEELTTSYPNNVLYFKDRLTQAKENEQIYYKQDSHWNGLGAFYAYQILMQKISPKFDTSDFTISHYDVPAEKMDLAVLMNIGDYFNDTGVDVHYMDDSKISDEWGTENGISVQHTYNNNAPIKKKVLVVGDSFRTNLIPYLSKTFREVISMHSKHYKTDLYKKFGADVVLHVVIERFMGGYGKINI